MMSEKKPSPKPQQGHKKTGKADGPHEMAKEINGFKDLGLPEPTRYNDWEVKGRCSDF